jgi:acid phosphatase (class A)
MDDMRSVLAVFLLLGLAGCHGQEFLMLNQRDFSGVMPPPPVENSVADLADLHTLLQLQRERTPAQVAQARRVSNQTPFSFAQPVLGEWFTPKNMPRTAAIFEQINSEERPIVNKAKCLAHRPRPYLRDPRIKPAVIKAPGDSYPSGHAADATIWATILTAAFPDYATAFQNQVLEAMWGRELGGAHYPTDTESGVLLGNAIAKRMLETPAMKKALAEIRAEAKAVRK